MQIFSKKYALSGKHTANNVGQTPAVLSAVARLNRAPSVKHAVGCGLRGVAPKI